MVKRKAEGSPCFVPNTEAPDLECNLPKDSSHPEPETLVADSTGSEITGETTNCHVSQSPATVADEGEEVAKRSGHLSGPHLRESAKGQHILGNIFFAL